MHLAVTRHTVAKAVAAVLIGALATLIIGPRPPSLSEATTGDRQLAERARLVLGDPGGLHGGHPAGTDRRRDPRRTRRPQVRSAAAAVATGCPGRGSCGELHRR